MLVQWQERLILGANPEAETLCQAGRKRESDAGKPDLPLADGLREVDGLARGTWVRFVAPAAVPPVAAFLVAGTFLVVVLTSVMEIPLQWEWMDFAV